MDCNIASILNLVLFSSLSLKFPKKITGNYLLKYSLCIANIYLIKM